MTVINAIPKTFIVAETKLDEKALKSFLEVEKEPTWQKRWLGKEVSDTEKSIDLSATYCENVKQDVSTEDLFGAIMQTNRLKTYLNHGQVTVMFHRVSFIFAKKLLESRIDMNVNCQDINFEEMGFWYPPAFDIEPELALGYGKTVEQYDVLKEYLISKMESLNDVDTSIKNKAIMDISRLFPITTQINMMMTTGLGNWMELFEYFGGDFNTDHELRMVILHLASVFKKRYPLVFKDMFITDKTGTIFGFDSIKENINAWQNYRICYATK